MFDLNIDVCAENLANNGDKTASGETEASGTSESSVVNVDDGPATVVAGGDDRDSGNSMSALNFDIFRKLRTSTAEGVPDDDDNDVDEVAGNHGPSEFVTWQLFPVKGDSGGGGDDLGGGMSCEPEFQVGSSETQWLNLSVSGSASGSGALEQSEMRIPPPAQQQVRRSRRGPRSRSSQYRGVTFYRRTGRWESHIWDCGKQVYLGGFDTAYAAARAYDRAAIKFRGVDADINFSIGDYDEDMKQMKNLTKEEFVQTLRRQSTGFPRGSSRYRGVALQKYGRWEAQTGQYFGNKAYPIGREAATNFHPSNYEMKMPVQPGNGEHGHNLDLNLGISVSADGPRGNNSVGEGNPHLPFYHGRRPMVGSSYWLPNGQGLCGQPLPSSQSAVWHGAPAVSTTHVEGGTQERQLDTVPSSRLSNRAWNVQGGANQVVPLFSSAASSGFSF